MGLRGGIRKGRTGKHLQGAKIGIKCKSMLTGRAPVCEGGGTPSYMLCIAVYFSEVFHYGHEDP